MYAKERQTMMFTHEQLSDAVRQVGSSGKPFSSAAVRGCLGMTTQDRRTLTRFNNEFRAYQKASEGTLEMVSNNRYRLVAVETAPAAVQMASAPAAAVVVPDPVQAVSTARERSVEKAARFNLRALIDGLLRPVLRSVLIRGYQLREQVVAGILRASSTLRPRSAV
jgi:hypothetical protein